jgi:hypothetical protein
MGRISTPLVLGGFLCLFAAGCLPAAIPTGSGGATGSGGNANSGGVMGSGGSANSGGAIGTGGSANSGGATGSGGNANSGGATGTGGSGNIGGASGTGGTAGRGGMSGNGGSGMMASCTFTATASTSTKIPTVGIVTFTTTLSGVTAARIDFGPTTAYGLTAPVDLTAASYRTLLLGMKAARMYNYRITASNGSGECQSPNYTIMSGALANGFQKPTLTPTTASGLSGGFLITGQYQGAGAAQSAYILDADGDYVWWYGIGGDVTGARMSYDGKHMWINSANVPSGMARVRRVTMDGMTENDYSSQFTGLNHQLAILPDETVAFYAYGANGCDDIKERAPSGTVKTVVNSKTALKISDGMCHLNNIQYSQPDDSLVFSNLQSNQIAKVKRSDGSTIWIMNGSTATISGVTWSSGQHGIHLIDLTHIILFNNNNGGANGSVALEIILNGTTATRGWSYAASPAVANMVMGDVQRMSNGNTIVGYSTRGELHEVNSTGTRLQRWQWPSGGTFGYIEKRATLYGPPPR